MGWPGAAIILAVVAVQSAAPTSTGGVAIEVAADTGAVRVLQVYQLLPDTTPLQLQLLQRKCATVSAVTLVRGADTIALVQGSKGPWATFHDTSAAGRRGSADASRFEVHYTVSWQGAAVDVPLVHPLQQIPRLEGERQGGVQVTVITGGDVPFPRLLRAAPGAPWTGRFVAIPSLAVAATRTTATRTTAA